MSAMVMGPLVDLVLSADDQGWSSRWRSKR
jgi:hypothetical protein